MESIHFSASINRRAQHDEVTMMRAWMMIMNEYERLGQVVWQAAPGVSCMSEHETYGSTIAYSTEQHSHGCYLYI